MSISDLYSSGQHKMNLGHFANIVKIAKADEVITEEEKEMLKKVSNKLNINETDFNRILENPENCPINFPASYNERIERLYLLAKMVLADGKADSEELKLMRKIAIGLNFKKEKVENVCNEAISMVMKNIDLDSFIIEIKKIDIV